MFNSGVVHRIHPNRPMNVRYHVFKNYFLVASKSMNAIKMLEQIKDDCYPVLLI